MAILCPQGRVRELLAYAQIIIQLARSHGGGKGWIAYDWRFRQQVAAGMPLCWSEINPSLLSATVLGSAPAPGCRNCPLCLSWDHGRDECALGSLNTGGAKPKKTSGRYRPYSVPGGFCRRFNAGSCPNTTESCRLAARQAIRPQNARARARLHQPSEQ